MERWRPVAILLAIGFLVSCFSGCIGAEKEKMIEEKPSAIDTNDGSTFYKPHVVVAVIDDGINPYHEVFRRPNLTMHPSQYIPSFPKDAVALNLTFGSDLSESSTDAEIWKNVTRHVLYWIPGTNIMAYSINDNTLLVPTGPDVDDYPIGPGEHGTACAFCVSSGNPDVSLLMVECGMSKLEEAISWTINQSWVDVISISSAVLTGLNTPQIGWENVSKLTKSAVDCGKIIVAAGGNRIMPSIGNDCSGPPWIISVGGANKNASGEVGISAKLCDVVANYSTIIPDAYSTNGYTLAGGTSLSAPLVAGIISKIILELRKNVNYCENIEDGFLIKSDNFSISNIMIRDALNKTAAYWNTTDYNPLGSMNPEDPLFAMDTCLPIIPIAPFLQMGWGYIGPEIVNDAVDIILGKKQYEPSIEKQLAEPYMNAIYELRKQFWENYPG